MVLALVFREDDVQSTAWLGLGVVDTAPLTDIPYHLACGTSGSSRN